MKKNLNDYVIAFLVIVCSLVLLAALAFALSGWGGRKGGRTVEIDFPDVTGIHLHSEIRYAGAPAGSITAIRLLTFEERNAAESDDQKRNAVRVTATLRPEVPPLPADVRTSISSDTLLSDKFVALSAGAPDGPKLAEGAVLQGQAGGGLDALLDLGPVLKTALEDVPPLLKNTKEAIDVFKDGIGDALPKVSKLLVGLNTTSDSADTALKRFDKLIADADQPIKDDLMQIKKLLIQIEQTMGTADQLLSRTDRNLNGRMQELGVVLENLKVVSTHAKALTQQLAEKPNRLIFSGKAQKLTSEEEILRSKKPVPAVKP
ncbi:MAG: MlaD family protein [Chthoniobacter sp.]|nr:MlaD family protein [Chthoniobacter sp.]